MIRRQLDLFAEDEADLLAEAEEMLRRYDAADRDDAEELYGDYQLVVEAATRRSPTSATATSGRSRATSPTRYEDEFNRAAANRYPAFGVDLPNT